MHQLRERNYFQIGVGAAHQIGTTAGADVNTDELVKNSVVCVSDLKFRLTSVSMPSRAAVIFL